jgi:hypothetical protein
VTIAGGGDALTLANVLQAGESASAYLNTNHAAFGV